MLMSASRATRRSVLASMLSAAAGLWVGLTGLLGASQSGCRPATKYGGPPPSEGDPAAPGTEPPELADKYGGPVPPPSSDPAGVQDGGPTDAPPEMAEKYGGPATSSSAPLVQQDGGPTPPTTTASTAWRPSVVAKYGGPSTKAPMKYGGPPPELADKYGGPAGY